MYLSVRPSILSKMASPTLQKLGGIYVTWSEEEQVCIRGSDAPKPRSVGTNLCVCLSAYFLGGGRFYISETWWVDVA